MNKSVSFEWIASHFNQKEGYSILFILLINKKNTAFENYLLAENIPYQVIHYSGKKSLVYAFFKLCQFFLKFKPDIIHAHLFDACFVGLPAAWFCRIKRRVHTRHNSSLHHVYHPHAVKYDRMINALSTKIIAVSGGVQKIMVEWEGVDPSKIQVIHHGLKMELYYPIESERLTILKKKYLLSRQPSLILGVISRYIHWKGIQHIIEAYKIVLKDHPNALLILANAQGPYSMQIKQLLSEIPSSNIIEIEFEDDIFALFQLFDIFIHTPVDDHSEAFGQVYTEAMASKIPTIITLSGIALDYAKHLENTYIVPYNNPMAIAEGVKYYLEHPIEKKYMIDQAYALVAERFTANTMLTSMEKLYQDV